MCLGSKATAALLIITALFFVAIAWMTLHALLHSIVLWY